MRVCPSAGELPNKREWRALPFVVLVSLAFSFIWQQCCAPSHANPYTAAALLFCWWMLLSAGYLWHAGFGLDAGWAFVHWLLVTTRLRRCCLAGLLLGFMLTLLLRNALPMFICLGLVWPAYFISLGKAHALPGGQPVKILLLGGVILWLFGAFAICLKTHMAGVIDTGDTSAIPNPLLWVPRAYHAIDPAYLPFRLLCDVVVATLAFYGGWLSVGGTALARALPLALPAGERAAARSLVTHGVLYWGKLITITYLAYIVARGPLYAHPALALLFALVLIASAYFLAHTPPVRRLLVCAMGELDSGPATSRDGSPGRVQAPSRTSRVCFPLLGLLLLTGALCILELHDPFFFTQCDAYSLGTPLALHACRSLWHGLFCTWNPFQNMGLSIAANPQSFYAYPPLYLAYAIARHLLGNEYTLTEVFCMLHIVAAYFALYWWARLLDMRPSLALAVTLSFVLSGYVLVLGRSWGTVFISCCWVIPLAIAITLLQRGQVGLRWVLGTGTVIGCAYYIGFPQGWSYSLLFFIIALLLLFLTGVLAASRLLAAAAALLLGLAICLPILVPQLQEVKRFYAARSVAEDAGMQRAIMNMLLPYPLARLVVAPKEGFAEKYVPMTWGGRYHQQYRGQFYYSGTFFFTVTLVMLLFSTAVRWSAPRVAGNVWFLCGVLAFILCLGPPGVLWSLQKFIPLFAKFRGTMKMFGYLTLFASVGAGVMVERLLRSVRRPALPAILITVSISALMLYHCWLPQIAFSHFEAKPYPALPPVLAALLAPHSRTPQRAVGITRDQEGNPVMYLKYNFATLYKLYCFNGYDPLMGMTGEMLAARDCYVKHRALACKIYGIRWLLFEHYTCDAQGNPHPLGESLPAVITALKRRIPGVKCALRQPFYTVWELPRPDPLAFPEGDPSCALPLTADGQGVTVDLLSRRGGGSCVVNFLAQPWMRAFIDGKPTPIAHDKWGRMVVRGAPAGAHRLVVQYRPPWSRGFLAGALLALIALAVYGLAGRVKKREDGQTS